MKYRFTTLILLFCQAIIISGGTTKNPAIDVLHYEFNLAINDSTDIIEGKAIIKLRLNIPSDYFTLDFRSVDISGKGMKVSSVVLSGKETIWDHTGNILKVRMPFVYETGAEIEVSVQYSGTPGNGLIISRNRFGDRTFFSDHWPDRASNYLPVSDHPSDKATVDFIITAPSHYKVVSNGHLVEESQISKNITLTHWKEDVPLPVKVMAFAAAPFSVRLAGIADNIPVWSWVFSENRKEGFNDYSVAVQPMEYYSRLIGPYPYEKLANVQSRTIFGGLENASCIFYAENSVTGQGRAENLIAHEIAHQWFGNSVTESEWYNIWLSESFATYLANVYTGYKYGEENFLAAMISDRKRILRYDLRVHGSVVDTTVTDLMSLLNTDTYQKGGWVLHMLRNKTGDSLFWKGIRTYYQRFRNGNASTSDFRKVMEEVSGKTLDKFFYQWLSVPGEPELRISATENEKNGIMNIRVEQLQDFVYTFDLDIMLEDSSGKRFVTVPVSGKVSSIEVKGTREMTLQPDPWVRLLYNTAGN